MKLEIDNSMIDIIMLAELKEQISSIEVDIKKLKTIRKRETFQEADLQNDIDILAHIKAVYEYYGGNL